MTSTLAKLSTEKSVLSTVLNNISAGYMSHVVRVAGKNPEELFVDKKHHALFQSIEHVYNTNPHPSIAAIVDRVTEKYAGIIDDAEGFVASIQLAPSLTTVDQITSSVEQLAELREMRRLIQGMDQIKSDMEQEDVHSTPHDISTRLQEIVDQTSVSTTVDTFADVVSDVVNSPRPMWSIKTGITVIDNALGGRGLESGCFTIAAARPKVGKTILMNNLVHQVLDNGGYPLILNLETKRIEFVSKMLARHIADADVDWGKIKGYMTKEEMDKPLTSHQVRSIEDALEWSQGQEWFVSFDKNMTTHDIHALVMKAKAHYPLSLIHI